MRGLGVADRMLACEYEYQDAAVREFAASSKRLRRPERRRNRNRFDDSAVPFAERTWHRVLLAEAFRRRLELHNVAEAEPYDELPSDARRRRNQLSSRRMLDFVHGFNTRHAPCEPNVAQLLQDVRLDGKQRAQLVRYGVHLSRRLVATPRKRRVFAVNFSFRS